MSEPVQYRYEIQFSRGARLKYISHLDLMRVWERLLRRANLPVAHSQGFNPRPSLTFAAPLPVGVLSRGDLAEVRLTEEWALEPLLATLRAQAVPDLGIEAVRTGSGGSRSLPARMQAADYEITLDGADPEALAKSVDRLLEATAAPLRVERGKRVREVDVRPLVLALSARDPGVPRLVARLRHSPEATGRPDDLVLALGYDPGHSRITRFGLVLAPA